MTSHIELQALYRAEIARLRQDRDDYRLVAQAEAADRRRAHDRIAELEAENATMLSALKAMDEALKIGWLDPGDADVEGMWPEFREAWLKIRSAISQADKAGEARSLLSQPTEGE